MLELLNVKKNPISIFVLMISLIVFAMAQLTSSESVRFLAFEYSQLPQRWYAFLTYGFVHVDIRHIAVNMSLLIFIGIWVERLIGSRRYIGLLICSIIAGSMTLWVRETAGIGFSAAASALLFYYYFAFPLERELPFNMPNIVLPIILTLISVGSIVMGWMPAIGHYPHLAGALIGLLFLGIFRKKHRSLQ